MCMNDHWKEDMESLKGEISSMKVKFDQKVRDQQEELKERELEKERLGTYLKKENSLLSDKYKQLEEEHRILKEKYSKELSARTQQYESVQNKMQSDMEWHMTEKSTLKMNIDVLTTRIENESQARK